MSRAADPGCRLAFHPSRISRDLVEFVMVLYRYKLAMVDRHGWVTRNECQNVCYNKD